MALVRKISPVGIDVVIDKVQSYIYNNLVVEHQSYPRVYKNDTNNVGVIPEVYVNENEYSEVFFDDAYTVSSFWLVDDNTSYDEKATTTISVIFQVLLDEAYPSITHRADEEFINDISNILYDNPYNYEITNIVRGIDNVYSEFNRDQVKWDDISNFFVVRFDLEVTYDYNCETNIVGNNCAQAVVKNSDESFVQSINSGATYVLPDIDITLNSNGFLTIPSVQDQDIILVDQTDTPIVPTSIVGNKITVTTSGSCADATYENSDASFTQSIASGGTYVSSDIDITLNSGAFLTIPSNKDQDVELVDQDDNPITPDSVVGNKITVTTGGGTCSTYEPIKTGQTTSYANYDDGFNEYGRLSDFTTLSKNNPAGNTNRFTDELLGQTYTNKIYIDWSTDDPTNELVIGYCFSNQVGLGDNNWATWMSGQPYTINSFSDWYVANIRQAQNIVNFSIVNFYNYSPINYNIVNGATSIFTSTTRAGLPTYAWSLTTGQTQATTIKTSSLGTIFIKYFTYAELGL